MNYRQRLSTLLIFLIYIFTSCNEKGIISENINVEGEQWHIKEPLVLSLGVSDLDKFYNIYLNIDISEDFLTNNLWLFISTSSPSGNLQTDSIMYYVTDEKGKWFGEKKRSCISNKFLYKSYIKFPEIGDYIFNIQHGMREKDLPKLKKIGISIEAANPTAGN